MKEQTMTSIDSELKKKAQEAKINISGLLEDVLRNKLEGNTTTIPREDGEKCQVCCREERKATGDDLVGLTWLIPDEIWICSNCLDSENRKVVVACGVKPIMSKEKRLEMMKLAREFVSQPEIRKDILEQEKKRITG